MNKTGFQSRDLYSTAAVCAVLDVVAECRRDGDGRCVFSFVADERIPNIIRAFQQHTLEVNAFAYARALKDCKYLVHQV